MFDRIRNFAAWALVWALWFAVFVGPLVAFGQDVDPSAAAGVPSEIGWLVGVGVPPAVAMAFYMLGKISDRMGKGITVHVQVALGEEDRDLFARGVVAVERLAGPD